MNESNAEIEDGKSEATVWVDMNEVKEGPMYGNPSEVPYPGLKGGASRGGSRGWEPPMSNKRTDELTFEEGMALITEAMREMFLEKGPMREITSAG